MKLAVLSQKARCDPWFEWAVPAVARRIAGRPHRGWLRSTALLARPACGGTPWLLATPTCGSRRRASRCFRQGSFSDYLALTKPRLTALALLATLVGFLTGCPGRIDVSMLALTLVGAALVGAGANALNQWLERDADALMTRTRARPLPAGRLSPTAALVFASTTTGAGIVSLWALVNPLAGWLGMATVVSYIGLYTPLKRKTSLCTLVGAIPGALPPLIGWAGACGALGLEAWVLFAIVFLWQLPHFLAIAWVHRADYARAGFRMLPVVEPEGFSTARQMVLYGLALLPTSLLPTILGVTGVLYFAGAIVAGAWFVGMTIAAARVRSSAVANRLFLASIGYLPALLLLMVVDKTPLS